MISTIRHALDDARKIFFTHFRFNAGGAIDDVVNGAESQTLTCYVQTDTAFGVIVFHYAAVIIVRCWRRCRRNCCVFRCAFGCRWSYGVVVFQTLH